MLVDLSYTFSAALTDLATKMHVCIVCLFNNLQQKGGKGAKKDKAKGGEEGVELTPEEREARAKLRLEASLWDVY